MPEPRAALQALSVIIPTKDRPTCLERVVKLVLGQTVLPSQLVIVDQSVTEESRSAVETLFAGMSPLIRRAVRLSYIHEPTIPGAAVARNRGMAAADGAIWLFLDDDMEPERDFVEALLAVYAGSPSIGGVSGIITNYSTPSLAFRIWARTFLRGPFHDERQPIYWRAAELRGHEPIRVTKFGSGLMSFRADVVRHIRFDESLRGLPPGEDIDFCLRLEPHTTLVIAPRARIGHQPSPTGRSTEYWIKEYAQGKLYVYHRNWQWGLRNRLCCWWFELGCALAATLASLHRGSLRPWRAFRKGVREAANLTAPARSHPVQR
jgi:GT2 family glycosyltransferase